MSIFAPAISSFWRQIEDYGIDPEPLFKKHGVSISTLRDPNARVSDLLIGRITAELASQYINDATLTLTEISFQLGFSEISSFSRAYKQWTGRSPSEARKMQHQNV